MVVATIFISTLENYSLTSLIRSKRQLCIRDELVQALPAIQRASLLSRWRKLRRYQFTLVASAFHSILLMHLPNQHQMKDCNSSDGFNAFDLPGLYIPELAKLIYDNNKKLTSQSRINFMGFMVGNPVIDAYSDNWGYIDFLYYHALISDETYSQMKKACKFTHDNAPLSRECIQLMFYQSTNEYGGIDPYSIYAPACVSESSTNSSRNHFHRGLQQTSKNPVLGLVRQGYDPCTYDNSLIYFNRPDVQKAMHANTTGIPYPWVGCSDQLIVNWKDSAATVLPIYRELLNAGLRLWVIRYSTFLAKSIYGHEGKRLFNDFYSATLLIWEPCSWCAAETRTAWCQLQAPDTPWHP